MEDLSDNIVDIDKEGDEEVISYVQNDVNWFKIELFVSKTLITRKVKQILQKTDKTLKNLVSIELKETKYLISICGEDRDQVIESKMKINHLIGLSRKKTPFTHLITVPFNCEPLRQEFTNFKDNVLTNFKNCKGIDESLFQNPFKLHLTIGVLVLLDQNEILSAKRVLKQSLDEIVRPILDDKPLKVTVEGLDIMKGQPNRAHVLYAQIRDESNKFQSIADQIVKQFVKSGLLQESYENKVKLHITFMNSLFRQRILSKTYPNVSQKRIKRETFDAKAIIDSYNSYKFGEIVVQSIQLNDFSKTEDGFYGLVESIDLPKDDQKSDLKNEQIV